MLGFFGINLAVLEEEVIERDRSPFKKDSDFHRMSISVFAF